MRLSLSGIRTRVNRLAEQVRRESDHGPNWDELVALLQSARQLPADYVEPPLTEQQFAAWAQSLRAKVRSPRDVDLAEAVIAAKRS